MNALRILVVDDEASLCEVLYDLLALEGYEVTTCQDVGTARARLAEREYGLALLDVFLTEEPVGLELGKHIVSEYPKTSVVFMTGFANPADIESAFVSGAHACIGKPFSLDDVLRVVGAALDTRKGRFAA